MTINAEKEGIGTRISAIVAVSEQCQSGVGAVSCVVSKEMLPRLAPYLYTALRIVAGALFVFHGLQKLFGWFGGRPVDFTSLLGAAGFIETIGGALIAVGLFTQPIAFIASGEMAVAYFRAHLPRGPWPIENGGELAALYCFLFLYMAAMGSGRLSLDGILRSGRDSRR